MPLVHFYDHISVFIYLFGQVDVFIWSDPRIQNVSLEKVRFEIFLKTVGFGSVNQGPDRLFSWTRTTALD